VIPIGFEWWRHQRQERQRKDAERA
jgi:hypothetical protein